MMVMMMNRVHCIPLINHMFTCPLSPWYFFRRSSTCGIWAKQQVQINCMCAVMSSNRCFLSALVYNLPWGKWRQSISAPLCPLVTQWGQWSKPSRSPRQTEQWGFSVEGGQFQNKKQLNTRVLSVDSKCIYSKLHKVDEDINIQYYLENVPWSSDGFCAMAKSFKTK